MNTPDASPSPGIPHDASTAGPDIVITPAQSGQVIQLSRGQIIRVAHPGLSAEWQVDYASEIIEALTPPEKVRSPGPDGWRFRAIAPGQTDLVLTSIPEPCPEGTPCPPMTARFVFTIDVK